VPCGDEVLQQLDGVAFGDEIAGKKKKWKKRKKGAGSSAFFRGICSTKLSQEDMD
jgi:hypothetical protein